MSVTVDVAPFLNERELRETVTTIGRTTGLSAPQLRSALVEYFRPQLSSARSRLEQRLLIDGKGTRCAEALSRIEDLLIHILFDVATAIVFPKSSDAIDEDIAIVAVGGYGRATLAPGSDIDLLFLVPSTYSPRIRGIVEFILYVLWDMRQKVGHATRSIEDCIHLAKTDTTVMTAILEARYICGAETLFDRLVASFRREVVVKRAREFVTSKLSERDIRHQKSGESRYLVEPDVKDGKGGLRDLNTLFWIAKFLYATNATDQLAAKGAFSPDELRIFKKSENFLWAVRCNLHFASNRPTDRLTFDHQPEIAERLGYKTRGGLRHVERFMKHYFLVARDVGNLTRILCAGLEARQFKDVPTLTGLLSRFISLPAGVLPDAPGISIAKGRLSFVSAGLVEENPVNIIRLFAVAGRHGAEIHPDALKTIRKSLKLIHDTLRKDPQANALFIEILTQSNQPDSVLRMMNEVGVLGRFIPPFGKIVAMMQFNMYHHYTVDEHLIRAVGILAMIERGLLSEDHPLSANILPTVTSRRVLYLAVLFHDVAKGRKEDHSIAGERIALDLCPRLGLSSAETDTVAWLIRHHLLMSETAQMRDLNDFKTILDFAGIVQSLERLKLLLLLTVVDIRAVGPGVWNGWKGQLLRTLYYETEPVLSGGHTAVSRQERVFASQAAFFAHFPDWDRERQEAYAARHYDAYWLSVNTEKLLKHYTLIASTAEKAIATSIETNEFTAVTELTIYAPDHPRLLALITGACAAAGANIVGAQVFTTADGMALDTILVQREFDLEEDERRRAGRIADLVRKALRGELWLQEAVARAYRPRVRTDPFTVDPRVIIDNHSSNRYTVIEINGRDRIGLLYDLTEALYRLNLNIASAHVTTFGEKAIDVFYVTDLTGGKIENTARRTQIEQALFTLLSSAPVADNRRL